MLSADSAPLQRCTRLSAEANGTRALLAPRQSCVQRAVWQRWRRVGGGWWLRWVPVLAVKSVAARATCYARQLPLRAAAAAAVSGIMPVDIVDGCRQSLAARTAERVPAESRRTRTACGAPGPRSFGGGAEHFARSDAVENRVLSSVAPPMFPTRMMDSPPERARSASYIWAPAESGRRRDCHVELSDERLTQCGGLCRRASRLASELKNG
jgi:hypothetical protein